jgi:hypothetical protein
MPRTETVDPEFRGWVARQMVAQDARWAIDVVLSAAQRLELSAYIGLLLGHHFVRIAYEGAVALRSQNQHVGVPELADLLRDQFGPITARVRHVTKLLDDTKKTYEAVVEEFETFTLEHRRHLMGKAVRSARWLETDLGLYVADGQLVGATVPAAYRLGLSFTEEGTIAADDLRSVSEEWGGMLSVLGAASLDTTEPTATLDLAHVPAIGDRDRRSDRYLKRRFETEFPVGLKMVLLAVEGDINSLRTIVSHTAAGHEAPVFRARTVTLFHSLSALRHILARYPELSSPGMQALRQLMAEQSVQRLLSKQGRTLRNRCMHYEIIDRDLALDSTLPMFGIVEAVCSGTTMDDLADDVNTITAQVACLLRDWSPRTT